MKLLLAVDHSEVSRKAVRFVGQVLGPAGSGAVEITLYHVTECLPEFITERTNEDDAFGKVNELWVTTQKTAGEQLLDACKADLTAAGVPAEKIKRKLAEKEGLPEARRVIAALAIIEELKAGGYDIVAIGRRGSAAASGSFLGSVAEKITREAAGKTVWIID